MCYLRVIDKLNDSVNKGTCEIEQKIQENPNIEFDYEFKKQIKANLLNRIELYILGKLEYDKSLDWRDIASFEDVVERIKDMPKDISLKDYEEKVVGNDFVEKNASDWDHVRQNLPMDLLNILEPIE